MAEFLYRSTPPSMSPAAQDLPIPMLVNSADPAGYLPDRGLVDAVNVALILRQPLLVTGEPGTGKSQLAASVAYQLGFDPPLMFETKSTSVGRDLFYTFDNIGRFRASQTPGASADAHLFLTFNALGKAIVLANEPEAVRAMLPPRFIHPGRRRSIVLIDEIDKAPRDFPNDILNEIERLYFRIPELGEAAIAATPDFLPVVIITSNSEKVLPDAFLRRCIFYAIPFPDDLRLEQIILSRLAVRVQPGAEMLRDAIAFFGRLRQRDMSLLKRPGTAELLNWVAALIEFKCNPNQPIRPQAEAAQRTLYTLAKGAEDQEMIFKAFTIWVHSAA